MKKLQLKDFKVNSFVTGTASIKGGYDATCACSLPTGIICERICGDRTTLRC